MSEDLSDEAKAIIARLIEEIKKSEQKPCWNCGATAEIK
jgi:hypothetical protein